ncbi:YD repeat-containing protein [Luteibacter sp. W1I16]|uniref:RHS repeat domain-containing protein n=1 Tax=Luteibacter sp. W1I16 TaxID=3373922 RepID=UPI003D1AED28
MRILFFLVSLVFSTGAMAGEYYYTLDTDGSNPSATHYSTADQACQVAYVKDMAGPPPGVLADTPLPYQPPYIALSFPPKTELWQCNVSWTSSKYGGTYSYGHGIFRDGDNCTAAQVYNPMSGYCESPDEEQGRKELGDPTSPVNVGFVSCGDPVNPANGNVFETETDYADQDGEIRFSRSYNSGSDAGWSTTLNTHVYADSEVASRGVTILFEDGRTALFVARNGALVADGGELGTMTINTAGWTYTSQSNEQMTFDAQGNLIRWQKEDGRALTIAYSTTPSGDSVMTVTDSLGHQMVYTTHYGWPSSLVVGNLTITYTVDSSFRLTGVKKTWPGHSTSRSYLYEDSNHPKLLTGIVDERGIRASTWAYDSSGRAVSAAMAGGKGAFAFTYNTDGSTTVTNPLGHPVVYRFDIVQGAKRITAIEGEPIAGCPASNSTFSYTANAQLDSRTDALGHVTTYAYDALGRETSRTEAKDTPNERTITTTWNGTSFRPETVTTPDRATTYSYDPQGRLLSTQFHSIRE